MHFSERNLTNDTSTWIDFPPEISKLAAYHALPAITPWIALVSCDSNSTDASDVNDIFTLARDRGAVSAVRFAAIAVYSTPCLFCIDLAPLLHLFFCVHHQRGVFRSCQLRSGLRYLFNAVAHDLSVSCASPLLDF